MLEAKYKTKLIEKIKLRFRGCYVFHLDPSEQKGIPDLLILYKNKWAALEGKKSKHATHQALQEYHVQKMNALSFAAFIYPENEEVVLNDMEQTFLH